MVSIIIVTLGKDEELLACISSIREQVKTSHEIIVVNNGQDPLGINEPNIKTVENRRNLGFARAVNKGINVSSGEYLLLLNPDTKFDSDVISPVLEFMDSHPKSGICGIQLVFPDGSLQNSVDIIPNLATQILNKSLLKLLFPKLYPSKRSKFDSPTQVPSVIGAFMMIRKALVDAIGLLDERFFFYLEETDFCKRAADHGFEVWHLPELALTHYQGVTARKFDIRRKIEFQRSLYKFFFKHKGATQTALLFAGTIIKLAVEIVLNLPLLFLPSAMARIKRSSALFAWHVLGLPTGWGLEQ
jgi:GT2 family glycosyltransferase